MEVTIGQRKYGGPPPGYVGPVPGGGCEVNIFVLVIMLILITYHSCTKNNIYMSAGRRTVFILHLEVIQSVQQHTVFILYVLYAYMYVFIPV